jgi:hypothetical protein
VTATHRADSAAGRRPQTPTGRHLRAVALNDRADEMPGAPMLDVSAAAFGAVVRLRFHPESPLAAIAASVAAAARRHAAMAVPVREAEMLIRQELGEYVPTGGITREQAVAVHVVLFAALADELALTEDEIDELIANAEGAHPAG